MADTAPATESATGRPAGHDLDTEPATDRHAGYEPATDWLPVVEAAPRAGLGQRTVRRWAAKGQVRIRTAPGPTDDRLAVALADVLARTRRSEAGQGQPEPDRAGLLPVPREAWERVLDQLGNLHQAGQEVAELRELVGWAEERERFLRQQLGEARARLEVAERPPAEGQPRRRWWRGDRR